MFYFTDSTVHFKTDASKVFHQVVSGTGVLPEFARVICGMLNTGLHILFCLTFFFKAT